VGGVAAGKMGAGARFLGRDIDSGKNAPNWRALGGLKGRS